MTARSAGTRAGDLRCVVFCPAPLGIFEQALALQEMEWLGAIAIGFYADLDGAPLRWLPESRLLRYFRRRYYPSLDASRIVMNPIPSAIGDAAAHFTTNRRTLDKWLFLANHGFDRWVAGRLASLGNLAFGYESTSLRTFRRAAELGLPRVLYQPIACAEDASEILAEEARRFPAVAASLRYNWFPTAEIARRREERSLADRILCASSFTKDSLVRQGVDPEKVIVEPYGVDHDDFHPSAEKYDRFSVIWAGSFTQTKGIGYLLEALASQPVPDAELVLAGYPSGTDPVTSYEESIRVRRLGRLTRPELGKVMSKCHVHVFPTLLDGFGRNLIEAMASGLPVITTSNCAGPDLIDDGITGFIVPIRDPEAIKEKLCWVHENPAEAHEMGLRASARVSSLTKPDYRYRFARRISEVWNASRAGVQAGPAPLLGERTLLGIRRRPNEP